MIYYEINGTDRSGDVVQESLSIDNQIQQRADSASFGVFQGTKPSENQEVRLFSYTTIATIVGATITLNAKYQTNTSFFYPGQKLHIGIGNGDEEIVEVLTYTESTATIVLVAAPAGVHIVGDKIGMLIFGGVISRVSDSNVEVLSNIEYSIECVDYTKVFDKKLVADTWANVDSRYIINDFCNTTVNYNSIIDNLSYADNAAIQAEWIEASDGSNPTVNTTDFLEGTASGVFTWAFAGGTALWAATPTVSDISAFTGVNSGSPTEGELMIWMKPTDYTKITSFKVRIGSSAADYAELTFTVEAQNDWFYARAKFASAVVAGVPDWTAVDYAQIRIVQTASTSIKLNGLRVNAEDSFTLFNVSSTPQFDDLRSPQLKPTALMQMLAKTWQYVWFIDYEKDIHFIAQESDSAPFTLGDSTDNFNNLQIEVDQSQVGNRIIIRGGEKHSESTYQQVFEGDGVLREWLMKSKFAEMSISIDNNTSTDTMEATTTTTTVKATAHGLLAGDHVVMRSRGNVVRQVLTVPDPDSFTVEAVTSQVSGDTFSKFATAKTDGIEGVDDEASFDYMANSNEKSVRASSATATLNTAEFIRFEYLERTPIQLQYTDSASINSLKALGFGDGIFDLDPITDRNIKDQATAIALAQAKVEEFSNPIISGSFNTDQWGLMAGQVIGIQDSVRGINESYVIQKVSKQVIGGEFKDYFIFRVSFGTTLFGIIEFYQKLLRTKDSIELNTDDIVETFVTPSETIESNDVNATATNGGFEAASNTETVTSDDVNTAVDWSSGSWQFEPSVGQTLATRFDLADFG